LACFLPTFSSLPPSFLQGEGSIGKTKK
jgi:hypothetical protein